MVAATGPSSDHDLEYLASLFVLEIDGAAVGSFTGVAGLGYDAEVVEYKHTDNAGNITIRKRPGRVTYPDIVLKRGLSADNSLVEWYQTVVNGAVERKSGSIVMFSPSGDEIGRWNFSNAWISKWSASDLSADSDDIVIEEVTITHEFMERA